MPLLSPNQQTRSTEGIYNTDFDFNPKNRSASLYLFGRNVRLVVTAPLHFLFVFRFQQLHLIRFFPFLVYVNPW